MTRKRKQKRIITINTKLLLWTPSQSSIVAFKELALKLLSNLDGDVYLVSMVGNDQEQRRIEELFESKIDPRKLLFCETKQGLVSICRHINPNLHLDNDLDLIKQIGAKGIFVGASKENIVQVDSLRDLLMMVNKV